MATITATVPVYTVDQLMQEHTQHVALINSIKNEVCQECDNLGENAVPLFQQLEPATA